MGKPKTQYRRRNRREPLPVIGVMLAALLSFGMLSMASNSREQNTAERPGAWSGAQPLATIKARQPVAEIVDGDTLKLGGETFRLHGIDAPEHDQTCQRNGLAWDCGAWATDVLRDLSRGGVTCDGRGQDRYGRTLAICQAGGRDLGAAMVEAGAAVAYIRYSDAYSDIEAFARAKEAGIWAGDVVLPEDFRAANR